MRPLSYYLLILCLSFSMSSIAQEIVPTGAGSYASFPPEIVWDEGDYFAKSYRELDSLYPFYLHERMQGLPVASNEWFSNTIFEQYTGELWVYPQMVEADRSGVSIAFQTGFTSNNERSVNIDTEAYLTVSGTVEPDASSGNQIILDFEDGGYPSDWTATGEFLTNGPRTIDEHNHSGTPANYMGEYYFDSYFTGNQNMGTLVSPDILVAHNYLHFLVAGGNTDNAGVRLIVADTIAYEAKGKNSITFEWVSWDLSPFNGQNVRVEIVDETTAGWGWIGCDHFVLSNDEDPGNGFTDVFWPESALAYDWTEISFAFSLEDNSERGILASMIHGVPFTYLDINELDPYITLSNTPTQLYDLSGNAIASIPTIAAGFVMEIDGFLFGLHCPANTSFSLEDKELNITFDETVDEPYIVVSNIPNISLISTYNIASRNKIVGSEFSCDMTAGKIETSFNIATKNYDTGVEGQNTIMAFLPHQWRNTIPDFSYLNDANYISLLGDMKAAQGTSFTLEYDFGGMSPFMPKPMDMSSEQMERLMAIIQERADISAGFNGNTYAKGLGEESNMMLMARELEHPAYSTLKENLKTELIDWLTFSEEEKTEKSYYFAEYPDYGAIIGFPPGYGSQGFNDLHFHNGYFIIGAARLMLVDEDFKENYGPMVKLIARSYASWLRYGEDEMKLPYLRNFDPYLGHSFAGGTGDGGGNNQESTSEALNSWFGIYALGVALNDQEILKMGATGFMLEGKSADAYWFDRYNDLPEEYPCDYVGVLRTNNVSMSTFFSGDPAWAFGIQFVPGDHFYNYVYSGDSAHYSEILANMIDDRNTMEYTLADDPNIYNFSETYDIYENVKEMGAYLGGYVLNSMQYYAPNSVIDMQDSLYINEGGEWQTHVNCATNYYVSGANCTYGRPAVGYYTDSPSSAVFKDADGTLVYILYNHNDEAKDINIYDASGAIIETINVTAGGMYNSKDQHPAPSIQFELISEGDIYIQNDDREITLSVSDKDNNVVSVELFINDSLVNTFTEAPYTYAWTPIQTGLATLKAKVVDADNQMDADTVTVEVIANNQSPFNGTAFFVPGTVIPAVEWDLGGELIAYEDEDEGNNGAGVRQDENVDTEGGSGLNGNTGWVRDGEWLEYTINVDSTCDYDITVNYASAYGGANFNLLFNDALKAEFQKPDATSSWADYQDYVVKRLALEAGEQVMRIAFVSGGANLKSFTFAVNTDTVTKLEDNKSITQAKVSPNPSSDVFNITMGDEAYNTMQVLTIKGTAILNKEIAPTNSAISVDLSSYHQGIYFLVLKNENQQQIIKLIKE